MVPVDQSHTIMMEGSLDYLLKAKIFFVNKDFSPSEPR